MCFEFGSCFGNGKREDYGGERPANKEPHGGSGGRRENRRNGAYYSGAADNKAPPAATYHNQPHAAALDEAGQKAYRDSARKAHHGAGAHGYPAYACPPSADETSKLPAWHNKVGDDAGYTYTYTGRVHETAADRMENSGMDYHHYPSTTTNTSLVRY